MVLCSICNGLQVDSTSNLSTEETSLPEPQRLRTFSVAQTLQAWYRSAEDGCVTCRLIWDALVRFDRDSVLEELVRVSSTKTEDDAIYIELAGELGGTLLLEFNQLPPDIKFPALQLYSLDSKHTACFSLSFSIFWQIYISVWYILC